MKEYFKGEKIMYMFQTVDQILRQVNTDNLKKAVGEDFYHLAVNTVKQEAISPRMLLILERWLRDHNARIQEMLQSEPGRRKFMMELKMQANEEQEYLELPAILSELENGQSINELLNQSSIDLSLKNR